MPTALHTAKKAYCGSITSVPPDISVGAYLGTMLPVAGGSSVTLLYVPKGTSSADPFEVRLTEPCAHLLVVCEEAVVADVTVELVGGSHTMEVFVGDAASLTISTSGSSRSLSQRGRVGTEGSLQWTNFSKGSVEHDLISEVVGSNAESSIDWRFIAGGSEDQKITARNVFSAADGRGEVTMKGVAEDKAHVTCHGTIDIGLGGRGTDTYLTEDVLMLDSTAKVDAVPGLNIKTNDVKASHSASVKKVTPADLFYFAARGIEEGEAKEMYVEGFLGVLR